MSIKERKIKIEPRLIESQQSNKEKNQELKKINNYFTDIDTM